MTNIPTPYRLHFCRVLSGALARRGWTFQVWFMAHSERGRHWDLQPDTFGFSHRMFGGLHPRVLGATLHLNPGIPISLWRKAPRVLFVAGGWPLPTNILLTIGARLMRKSTTVFWSESHLESRRRRNGALDALRGMALRMYHGFAVPGRLARDYVNHYAPGRPVLTLPNVVDEDTFGRAVSVLRADRTSLRQQLGIERSRRLLVTLARLIPEKGVLEFVRSLSGLPSDLTSRLTFVVGGEGPLRSELEAILRERPDLDVRLVGHLGHHDVLRLLAAADGFALPSRSEPNPLSVIEALWAGLPLLLSDRVGNHPDLLEPGVNGWLFDVDKPESQAAAVAEWLRIDGEALKLLGCASHARARRDFCSATVVDNFLDQLLPLTA